MFQHLVQPSRLAENNERRLMDAVQPGVDRGDLSTIKFDRSVSCLCWAYNEEVLIENFLLKLHRFLEDTIADYEIVIVDDGSTDQTKTIIKELQQRIARILLVENERNLNVGLSFRRALQAASKEYLFWQTVDWSYDIQHLRSHLELLKHYDVVCGSRFFVEQKNASWFDSWIPVVQLWRPAHLKKRSDSLWKAICSVTNYTALRLLFGVPISDFQNVCMFRTKFIQSLRYEASSSFVNPEGLIKAYRSGASMAEVLIPFMPRQAGTAKGTKLKAIFASICDTFRCWFRWVLLRKLPRQPNAKITRILDGQPEKRVGCSH